MTKLTVVLLVTACLQVSARGYSQKLTLSDNEVSLKKVFKEIRHQTGFLFFYSDELLQQARKVSIHVKDAPLRDVLDSCFRDQPLRYEIDGNIIVVDVRAPVTPPPQPPGEILVHGRVTDPQGVPLPGVSVTVAGTSRGVATNEVGEFSLTVDSSAVLHFSYTGYTAADVAVKGHKTIVVALQLSQAALNDVVVVGYGTQRKVNLTGAVDQITPQDLAGKPDVSMYQLLQGVSPNLIIQQPDPSPGAPLNFNIRGVGTMQDNTPLVVIDGITGGNLSSNLSLLNPQDIESISVLKDAGAAAIYGSRAANGVLLVTTKKGKKNQHPTVTYNGTYGVQDSKVLISPLPAWENAIYKNESLTNVGLAPIYAPADIQALKAGGDHEWFLRQILHHAPQQSHNVSLTGGGQNSTFLLSLGNVTQASNLVGPRYGYTRYNVRAAATSDYGILKAGGTLSYTHDELKQNSFGNGFLMADAERTPTNYKMVDSLGRYLTNSVLTQFNPLGVLQKGGYSDITNDDFFGNVSAEIALPKGFSIKGVIGGDMNTNHNFLRVVQVNFYPQGVYGSDRSTGDTWTQTLFTNMQLMAEYNRNFGDHHVSALVGASNESSTGHSSNIYYMYTDSILGTPTTGSIVSTNASTTAQNPYVSSLNSLYGRANYNYKGRYLVEFDARYDGSSKFRQGIRYGFFPSVSAGWKLTDETFMEGVRGKIGELKLRGSYGVLGNQSVGNYQYLTTYSSITNAYGFNNTAVAGEGFTFSNPDLTWERAATLNGGLDAYLLNRSLTVSLDYFNKLTTHILVVPAVPGTFGTTLPNYNAGKMRDQGWEASVKYVLRGRQFTHSFSVNLADSRNEVVYFQGNQQLNGDAEIQTVVRAGVPFNSYVGYKRDGYYQTPSDVAKYPKLVGVTPIPGDIKYKDKNGDGIIDNNDLYVLGNPFPRYTFGFTYNVTFKNFDLNIFIQGVGRRTVFVRGELVDPFQANYSYNIFKHQLNFWTPTNPNAAYPILSANGSPSQQNDYNVGSNLYLFNGAYARLKNVQLGYSLSPRVSRALHVQHVRVYFTGQNLYTLAKIKFLDPESTEFNSNVSNAYGNNQSGRVYPTPVFYGGGLDVTF